MASAIVAIGSALLVNFPTNNETEKKITTVKLASALPKNPGAPTINEEAVTQRAVNAKAG